RARRLRLALARTACAEGRWADAAALDPDGDPLLLRLHALASLRLDADAAPDHAPVLVADAGALDAAEAGWLSRLFTDLVAAGRIDAARALEAAVPALVAGDRLDPAARGAVLMAAGLLNQQAGGDPETARRAYAAAAEAFAEAADLGIPGAADYARACRERAHALDAASDTPTPA
ncbi:MAG TPA: hypothetical protein VEB20_14600, partial [Azospirillaceae bacterium]|nr:hypothetical protein [Azospirillaceae bacterium]